MTTMTSDIELHPKLASEGAGADTHPTPYCRNPPPPTSTLNRFQLLPINFLSIFKMAELVSTPQEQ
jgi:hypothetical protein